MPASVNHQIRPVSGGPWRLVFCSLLLGTLGLAALPALAQRPSTLFARWKFDDPANLGLDSSKNALHAKVVGARPAEGRTRADGGSSGAIAFDGVDAFLEISKAKLLGRLTKLTVEAWVFGYGGDGNLFFVPGSLALEGGALQIEQRRVEVSPRIEAQAPVERWYHLAAVFDGPEARLYVDGRLANLDILSMDRLEGIAAAPWILGAGLQDSTAQGLKPENRKLEQPFRGRVDEMAVHKVALSAAEILKHAEDVDRWPRIVVERKTGAAIQEALDQASRSGSEVYLPVGDYLLKRALVVPGGVMLRGERGAVLKPEPSSQYRASPAIILNGVQGVTLRDFALDGQASVLEQRAGHLGILISGSSHVHLDHVTVSNLGFSTEKAAGTHLRLETREADDPKTMRGIPLVTGMASERNVIENCRFSDPEYMASLGVRLITSWQPRAKGATFAAPIRKTILRNNLLQGFAHNAMEIAGPATEHNLIRENSSIGAYLTAIEADKGARFNLFLRNRVMRVSFPKPAVVAAMRDQGAYPDYWAEGNVFRGNTISGVKSEKWAAGILLSFTRNGIFRDNVIRGISSRNPEKAAGIVLRGGQVENYSYSPNTIDDQSHQVKLIAPPAAKK